MGKKIDRTGEERVNNFGSKMIIRKYRKYFLEQISLKNSRCLEIFYSLLMNSLRLEY